jgi:hypothetical protein
MYKEIRLDKFHLSFGYSLKQIALGFSLNKYGFSIDFLFFWISVEF